MIEKITLSLAAVLLVLAAGCVSIPAQERSLTGSVAAGWAYGRGKSALDESRTNPFTELQLDHHSYFLDPRFITYRAQPMFTSGFEDFYLGQPEGTGVRIESTFLPERPWPFRFSYEWLRRLSLTSGLGTLYSQDNTTSLNSRLGLGTSYSVPGRPNFTVQFDKITGSTDPERALFQGFATDGSWLSVYGRDYRKGWILDGSARMQRSHDLVAYGAAPGALQRTNRGTEDLSLTAQRNLTPHTQFIATAVRSAGDTRFAVYGAGYEFSQVRGQVIYFAQKKWYASVQADAGRNSARSELVPMAGQANPLAAFSLTGADRGAASTVRYFIRPYLNVSGRSRFAQTEKPAGQNMSTSGSFLSGEPGVELNKGGRYWAVHGGYNLILSRVHAETENSGQSRGQAFNAGFALGDPGIVRAGADYQASRSRVERGIFFGTNENSQRLRLDLTKRAFRVLELEATGGFEKRRFDSWNLQSDNVARDYSFRMQSARVQLAYSRRVGSGDAWQLLVLNPFIAQNGAGATPARLSLPQLAAAGVPLGAHGWQVPGAVRPASSLSTASASGASDKQIANIAPDLVRMFSGSSLSATTATASVAITRRILLHGSWLGQRQAVGQSNPYRYEQQNAALEWRFRRMSVEASYYMIRYDIGTPIFRKLFMIKISRQFRIL